MYRGDTLFKVRYGHYKAHLYTWGTPLDAQAIVSTLTVSFSNIKLYILSFSIHCAVKSPHQDTRELPLVEINYCVCIYVPSTTDAFILYTSQGYHYCPGERIVNLTQDEMLDFTQQPLLFHLGRDPGEKYAMK